MLFLLSLVGSTSKSGGFLYLIVSSLLFDSNVLIYIKAHVLLIPSQCLLLRESSQHVSSTISLHQQFDTRSLILTLKGNAFSPVLQVLFGHCSPGILASLLFFKQSRSLVLYNFLHIPLLEKLLGS